MNKINAKSKKTLIFCSSIAQADSIAEALQRDGYSAIAYHSKKSKKQNERVLESFSNNAPFQGSDEQLQDKNLFSDGSDKPSEKIITHLVSINKLAIGFDVPDIQLGVILRPSKIRSLMVQIVGRMKRLSPNKHYAEILDMAQLLSYHGFVDTDHYDPPIEGADTDENKELLDKATKHLKLESLSATLDDDEFIPITREAYNIKIEELKSSTKRLSNMTGRELSNKLEVEEDPVMMIAIAVTLFALLHGESYTAKNGKEVKNFRNTNSISWMSELWIKLLPEQDEYHKRKYTKALRTRIVNMLKDKSSIWGIRFFIEFLITEDTPTIIPEPNVETSHTIIVDGIEVEIDDGDIPF